MKERQTRGNHRTRAEIDRDISERLKSGKKSTQSRESRLTQPNRLFRRRAILFRAENP